MECHTRRGGVGFRGLEACDVGDGGEIHVKLDGVFDIRVVALVEQGARGGTCEQPVHW